MASKVDLKSTPSGPKIHPTTKKVKIYASELMQREWVNSLILLLHKVLDRPQLELLTVVQY